MNILDDDNFKLMEGLVNSAEARLQQAEQPDIGFKTTYGVALSGEDDIGEGYAVARRPRPLDKAPEFVRGSLKGLRTVSPTAGIAGAGALIGGLPSEGIGAIPGALAALGAKGLYDIGSGMVVNPLAQIFLGKDMLPSSNVLFDKALDYAGVPYPETDAEQSMFNIGRAALDSVGGGTGIGRILAKAAPEVIAARGAAATLPQRVGATMQQGPVMDMAQGASGQAAVELVDPDGNHPIADFFISMLGGVAPPVAAGTPKFLAGTREMTPAHQDAMRAAMASRDASVSNSQIARTPEQIQNFIRDAESSGSVSAGVRAAFQGRNPFEAMANRVAVSNVEKNILQGVLNPQEAIQNIENASASGLDTIPNYRVGSVAAANDEGVAQALSPAQLNPRVTQRQNLNQGALSQFSTDIATPVNRSPGAYSAAAAERQKQFVSPAERALADTDASIALQEQTIRDIELQRAMAENELTAVQGRLAENAPATQRQASSAAAAKEYRVQYGDLQAKMDAAKDPAELSKPISTDPIARGVAESMNVSATALQPTNPIIENIQQQLGRFGVEPTSAPEAPSVTKTVIAAAPSAAEGASVPPPASGMSAARAAQIEAGIAAMPEPKGPVRYLGGISPVESTTKTPSGQFIKVRRKIVEFDDVARSGDAAHPPEFQNRNRQEITSQNQTNDIYAKFNPPEITGSYPSAGTGAPIVGPQKNILEGGHGRMTVLERVLKDPAAAAKRAAYIDELTRAGHDVSGFKNPVEVQERVTPLTPAQVEAYVADMNQPTVAQLSTGDMARADSGRMMKGAIASLDPTKPLDHPANAEFVTRMNAGLGATELQPYINSQGGANSALVKRYQDGLNQAAYGGRSSLGGKEPSAAEVLLRSMRDDTDPMVKSIAGAMDDASGGFAKLRMMVKSGEIDPKYDLGSKVAEAAAFVRQARLEGQHPMDMLNQNDMFGGPDSTVRSIVELFYNEGSRRQVGTKALGQTLTNMASDALQQKTDMFGGSSLRSPDEIIQMAKRDIGSPERAAQAAAVTQVAPQAVAAEAPQVPQALSDADASKLSKIDKKIEGVHQKIARLSEKEAALTKRFNAWDPGRANDAKSEVKKIQAKVAELSVQKEKLSADRESFIKKSSEQVALEPAEIGPKRGSKTVAAEPTEMLKDTGATESTPVAPEVPPPAAVDAVMVSSAPPEVLTVENAAAVLDDLNAKMRAASRAGGVEYTNTKNELQPLIDELTAQLASDAPNLMAAKQLYAEAAPDLIHGVTSKIRKAGPGGSPSAVQPSKTLELWFKGEPSAENAKQLSAIMGKTPENVDAVRQFAMSSVAASTGEKATGSSIRAWVNKKAQIFEQPQFASIREEILQYANQIDNESTRINQAGRDIEAARADLKGLQRSRGEAESSLSFARKTAGEAGSAMIASGDSGIREVLSSPEAAREAVSAASTPQARADLDNTIRDYIDRSIKNTAVNADRPVTSGPVEAEDLNVSMAKTIRDLTDSKSPAGRSKRRALEILTSPEHVRRLDMLANALEAEAKQTKLIRGGSPLGSDTAQKTATQRAAQAASPFYRRMTMTALNALSDTNTARQFLADVALNKDLLKEILRMHKANDLTEINGLLKFFAKRSKTAAASFGQRDSGWRKREQEEEEEDGEE